MTQSNKTILDEANRSGKWCRAKNQKPLWAEEVTENKTVKTLEGEESVSAGDFLCRGAVGDIWPQSADSLHKKYDPTDEVDQDGWRKYVPKPDAEGVMAIQIDHPFAVTASWGELNGKAGDYLLKNFVDKDTLYPADVWVVDKEIFEATYEIAGDE